MAVLKAQVASLRAQVGSLQGQIVALEETLDLMDSPEAPPACTHASCTNVGTFGEPVYQCDTCKVIVRSYVDGLEPV